MYDEALAERIRAELSPLTPFTERKMFGGLAFLINGHMACGIVRDELMIRTGPEWYQAALAMPHARPMDFTGRPMRGMLMVSPPGFANEALTGWVQPAARIAAGLPPKAPRTAARRRPRE